MNFTFAPEHPVFAVDLRGSQLAIPHLSNNGCRFGPEIQISPLIRLGERRSMFFPVNEICRGCDSKTRGFSVPLRVCQNIHAPIAGNQTRVFASAVPFIALLLIVRGIENRSRFARETQAILTRAQAEPRGMHSDFHRATVIFSSIKQENLVIV